ncbi:MAG: NADH-quinone oxidoreductase subunit L [Nanoarchaeota archaeon]|nr:NADH-quinone oxidoreductase subunit L [Nanoarchaeota archaeon]
MGSELNLREENLISRLYDIKRKQDGIKREDVKKLAEELKIPFAKAYQIASFYTFPNTTNSEYNILSKVNLVSFKSHEFKDYISHDGYESFKKSVELPGRYVLEEVEKSKLRGRGGAGFPAAKKWRSCRNASNQEKFLIANGHNGDPGSNSDRYLMAYHSHQLIEGMLIAAYAIGASQGIVYVEGEFQDSVQNLDKAIRQAYSNNLLGKNILGSGFDFDLKIFEAAGMYVCGESTALMRAIEGKVGEPRVKHVHTAEKGLFDKPTVLNNVETLINVPTIIKMGGEFYAKTGTETSTGTKVSTLSHHGCHPLGICEVPMGATLSNIIHFFAGIDEDSDVKAVQIGGPLGGYVPKRLLNTKLCFDELSEVGVMMGDAITVFDASRWTVPDNAIISSLYNSINFLKDESCGKCISCKETLRRTGDILKDLNYGQGKQGDLELLERLGSYAKDASLCQLGKSIFNPVHTAIKYFREDFEKQIKE